MFANPLSHFLFYSAYAANPGGYAGISIGGSKLENPSRANYLEANTGASLAGRVFSGYNFNHYVGLEASVTHFGTFKYSDVGSDNLNAIDIVAKGYLPIQTSGINLYALDGAAYARYEMKDLGYWRSKITKDGVQPVFGLGVSYD